MIWVKISDINDHTWLLWMKKTTVQQSGDTLTFNTMDGISHDVILQSEDIARMTMNAISEALKKKEHLLFEL